jgi:hypothetical protein
MRPSSIAFITLLAATTLACGPGTRNGNGGGDDTGGGGGNGGGGGAGGVDGGNNGSCGTVDQAQSQPLALPDTNQQDGNESMCSSSATCGAGTPNCIIGAPSAGGGECAASYTDTLDFVGFGSGETLTDVTKLISVCATVEHSWLGDLEIDLISPDGKSVALRQFLGRGMLGPFFLGHPNFCDSDDSPVAGTGYKYCWTAAAPTKLLNAANDDCAASGGCEQWDGSPTNDSCQENDSDDSAPYAVVPAGNYLPDTSFSALQGAQLNGKWTFRVTDLWQIDNGFLFDWSIQFDSSLVANCSVPIIE